MPGWDFFFQNNYINLTRSLKAEFILEKEIYHEIALLEKDHWWYVSRRKNVDKIISGLSLTRDCNILEIGCGTGGNLGLLSKYGKVHAMEMDSDGMELANKQQITKVEYGKLPEYIPFGNKSFDFIIMLDVLEHIEDDELSIKAVYERLKPDGVFILTVPAFKFLWSFHDIIARHKRRYTRKNLCALLEKCCFSVTWSTYYNSVLFPVIFFIIGCVVFTVLGQLLLKQGAIELKGAGSLFDYLFNLYIFWVFHLGDWQLFHGLKPCSIMISVMHILLQVLLLSVL